MDINQLPDDVLLLAFRYLSLRDRRKVMFLCKRWYNLFTYRILWRNVSYEIPGDWLTPNDTIRETISAFGQFHRHVTFKFYMARFEYHRAMMDVLNQLTLIRPRQIESVTVIFYGDGEGLRSTGQEFSKALQRFFLEKGESDVAPIKYIDLSRMNRSVDGHWFRLITKNNWNQLTHLNIQSGLYSYVSPGAMLSVIMNIPNLTDLRIFHVSASDEVIQFLASKNDSKLRHLSLLCTKQSNYHRRRTSDAVWQEFTDKLPQTILTIVVQSSCYLWRLCTIIKPQMPLYNLFIEQSMLADTLKKLSDVVGPNLRKLVFRSPFSWEVEDVLMDFISTHTNLRALYLANTLRPATFEQLQQNYPRLKHNLSADSYTFLSDQERFSALAKE